MARKKLDDMPPRQEVILTRPMEEVMHDSMIPYAEYVILDRALPRVEDGLKPVQRRILYTMHELALWPDKPHRKCARIVGDCLGKYHPHGDTSVYDALVRLAQDFSMRMPLVDGHGNFGSIDGDGAAAMRYTEARMRPLALEMLRDIDKDTVTFALNFDDTLKEPVVLPASYPNLLVNGSSGIAVGIATNIPPHNLGEVIDAVVAQMHNPDITLQELMQHVKGPDFPTGGVMIQTEEIARAYESGRGKIQIRAKCTIEKGSAGRQLIVISEVPYQVSKSALLEKIAKLAQEKKEILGGIHSVRDESDRSGIRGVIELKKDADADKILAYLYKYTPLQTTFGVNMMAIADGKPRQLGLKQIIAFYIKHRRNVVTRRTQYDLERARAREHILAGLMIAIANIDEVIAIIRASKNPAAARDALMARFELSQVQAQAILDMRLQRLTALQIDELKREYAQICKTIEELEGILASDKKLLRVIQKELLQIKAQYADARRTDFLAPEGVRKIDPEEFAVVEDVMVVMNAGGYVKRLGVKTPIRARAEEQMRESEAIRFAQRSATDRRLLFVTNYGRCYRVDVSDIPDGAKARERGKLASALCGGFEKDEQVVEMLPMPDADSRGSLMMMTRRGMAKRTALCEYAVRSKKFPGISLRGDDAVVCVQLDDGKPGQTLLMITKKGMSINVDPSTISATGRTTAGVHVICLEPSDEVIFAKLLQGEGEIALFTDRGYAKRMLVADFDLQGRNGKGARVFPFRAGTMPGDFIASAVHVTEPMTLTIVRKKSEPVAISTESIPIQMRADKGSPIVVAMLDDVVERVW
jgi:DNA gyrase subunit A